MLASDKIKAFIASNEKFHSESYLPTRYGRWTIGYGTIYHLDGSPIGEDETMSEEYGLLLLKVSVEKIAAELSEYIIPKRITQREFDAVVSICHNIGVNIFLTSRIGRNFYKDLDISDEILEIEGDISRREKEREIYLYGFGKEHNES